MKSQFNLNTPYHYSENITDLLDEYLNEENNSRSAEYNQSHFIQHNPKITFFEQRIAALEGGSKALAVQTLHKAKVLVFSNLLRQGDNIITFNSENLYKNELPKLKAIGVEVRNAHNSLYALENHIDEQTGLIYLESISDEELHIPDFSRIAALAQERGIPVVVDNTSGAGGYFAKPLLKGASIVIQDTSAYIESDLRFPKAVIVESINFRWREHVARPEKYEYYQVQHNALEKLHSGHDEKISFVDYLRNSLSGSNRYEIPEDPFRLIKSLEEFYEKAKYRAEQVLELARALSRESDIKEVNYPGLPGSASYFKALTNLQNGFGTRLIFWLKDSSKTASLIKDIKAFAPGLKVSGGEDELIQLEFIDTTTAEDLLLFIRTWFQEERLYDLWVKNSSKLNNLSEIF